MRFPFNCNLYDLTFSATIINRTVKFPPKLKSQHPHKRKFETQSPPAL